MINLNQEDHTLLNIANITTSTYNLGPGDRAVIWVQGCPHRCPGCVAIEWLPFAPARLVAPAELLEELLVSDSITGLTFSGGEPMAQAAGLALLAKLARKRKDLDVICFSGYRIEQLLQNPPNAGVLDLLKEIDVLIDGPYIRSLNDSTGLRGSSNQRIIHLSDRLKGYELEKLPRRVDLMIESDQVVMVGIPPLSLEGFIQGLFPASVAPTQGSRI